MAEDGLIPAHCNLTETDETEYWVRTQRNVQESDATLIITSDPKLAGGLQETADYPRAARSYTFTYRAHSITMSATSCGSSCGRFAWKWCMLPGRAKVRSWEFTDSPRTR
jgi:hypothetical protein